MVATAKYWATVEGAPKRQNRFLFECTVEGSDLTFFCKTAGRPGQTVTEAEHRFLNHKFYFPGIVEWETLDVTLVDPVDPSMTQTFYNHIQNMGWIVPSDIDLDADGVNGMVSKKRATAAIGGARVSTLNADGKVSESWNLKNVWVQAVKFNDFDYSGDDLMDCTLTLRFDWAELETGSAAIRDPFGAAT